MLWRISAPSRRVCSVRPTNGARDRDLSRLCLCAVRVNVIVPRALMGDTHPRLAFYRTRSSRISVPS